MPASDFAHTVYWKTAFALIWIVALHLFIKGWWLVKYVQCPQCGHSTMTKDRCEALPDSHSAYCKQCEILWDLGIGNSD